MANKVDPRGTIAPILNPEGATAAVTRSGTATQVPFNLLWLGNPNLDVTNIQRFDPSYTGHNHIAVVNEPKFMTAKYPEMWKNLKACLNYACTSYSGIPEMTLNRVDQVGGFSDRKIPHAGHAEFNFDSLSMRVLEFKGLPVWDGIRVWMEGISDPTTKISDYKGWASGMDNGYSLANHTASFIVFTSDPTYENIVGRAHYITAAFPLTLPNDHFNNTGSEIGIVEGYDLSFAGALRTGVEIDKKAAEILERRRTAINYFRSNDEYNLNGKADGLRTML